ncbi:MAG: FecR domain-containing protein, partial [Nitrospirae bacterium]|nr:FecR domain-containing protein [Nitrospirota bacterium]
MAGIITGALIMAVLFSAMSYAAEPVGRILAVKGTVSVVHAGAKKPVPGAKNAQVFLGDRLSTGKASKVKLLMKDESIVTLGQSSELTVDQFVYAPETNTRKSVLKLASGMVRNLIAKSFSGIGSVFEVHTPTAVAGAMGTENLVWVFRGETVPTTIAGIDGGAVDISRIVLNSQFVGGKFMDYGSPGSIDWLRLSDIGDGGGGNGGGNGGDGNGGGGNGGGDGGGDGGPLNTLGVGISNNTQFGNQYGSVILNNGFASYAPQGFGPTDPFLLPPGTFNTLLGATDLSEDGGGNGDDGNDGDGRGGDGGGGDGGGDGGGGDGGGDG